MGQVIKVSNGSDTFEVDESRLAEAQADGFRPLVKVSNGKETYDVHPDDLEQAKADGFTPASAPSSSSGPQLASIAPMPDAGGGFLETAGDTARGAAQGATLGFSDELVGAVGAGADALRKMSLSNLVSDYVARRDAERKANAEAKKRSPIAYGAGQFGGSAATALVPGGAAAKLIGMGAAEGLGSSEADLTKGEVVNAALDTGKGASTGFVASRLPGVKRGLEEVATNPQIAKVAAVNPGGRVADAVMKRLGLSLEEVPGMGGAVGNLAKRAAGHWVPGAHWAQKASDAAAVVQKGATIAVETIDKIAPKLGKYGPMLLEAASRGGSSLATTNFLLQQTDPEYQEIVKNLND
jgi:hypothetical protein